MTSKSMWGWIGIALALFILGVTALLCGCSSTKNSAAEDFKKSWLQILSDSNSTLREENKRLEMELRQASYGHVEFQPICDTTALRKILTAGKIDPAVIDQYLALLQQKDNEAELTKDGLMKVKGALKSVTFSYTQAMRLVSEWKSKYDSLALKKSQTYTQTVHHYQTTTKTRTWFPWWLIIAVFIAGWIVRAKVGTKTFRLFNKKISL